MNNNRHKDKDYYNKYNRMRANKHIVCNCGKEIKLSCKYMHLKTKIHALNLRVKDLEKQILSK